MTTPSQTVTKTVTKSVQFDAILGLILELLEEITADWDTGPVSAATELGSLGIESINLVYLLAELQQEYSLGDRLLRELRSQQIDIRRLLVGELAELVERTARPPQEARP